MERVLVTGGAGFIGSNLVAALRKQRPEARITVLDRQRSSERVKELEEENCRVIAGDVLWFEPDEDYSAVFHLASITDTTVEDHSENLVGFHTMLEAFRPRRTPIVYASSASVYGLSQDSSPMRESQQPNPSGSYSRSKWQMERLAALYSSRFPEWSIAGLRYFNVYGPGENHKGKSASMIYQLFRQMSAGERPRLFRDGEQKRDFVHVSDVVAMTMTVMDAARQKTVCGAFNCGSSQPASFNEVVHQINAFLGTSLEPDYFPCSYPEFFQPYTHADMSLAASTFGFVPRWSPEAGIKNYLSSLKTQL